MRSGVPVVDLFAGVGGLGLGAGDAGGDVRLSVEMDPVCCRTLRANKHPGAIFEGDVADLTGRTLRRKAGLKRGDPLVIVGGPPCQPFSKAAYWTDPGDDARYREARANGRRATRPQPITKPRPDKRRSLLDEFHRLVCESAADGFVFENVPSILHPRNRRTAEKLMRAFESEGYNLTLVRASAVEFGVPQQRERVFILGHRKAVVVPPEPTHNRNGSKSGGLRKATTAGQVLRRYAAKKFFEPEEVVQGKWAEHLRTVPPGMNYKAHTAWAGHPNPTFEAERRFWNFLLKLHPDRPSWTIPAGPGPWTGPFHWDSRRLRTPELAALQSFPHGFKFEGSRRERVRQIGNAVPPLLASKMIGQVLELVSGSTPKRERNVVRKHS